MAKKTLFNINFNESWLEEEKYRPWLESSLSNMGKRALESHMQRVRHKQKTPVKSDAFLKL